jgi:hypothetical protein
LPGSWYSSILEAPDGHDPNENARLTIHLEADLLFADSYQRYDIVYRDGKRCYVKDSDKREYRIRDWDISSQEAFAVAFQYGEKSWDRRFTLITPPDYDGLDFISRSGPGWYVRPNVNCLFRLSLVPLDADTTIKAVRLDPTNWEAFRELFTYGFRSHAELYQASVVDSNTLGHELGHSIGQGHIMVLLGDPKCATNSNADICYGRTEGQQNNIMGSGRNVERINALSWHDRIAQHTRVPRARWGVVTGDNAVPPRKFTLERMRLAPPARF